MIRTPANAPVRTNSLNATSDAGAPAAVAPVSSSTSSVSSRPATPGINPPLSGAMLREIRTAQEGVLPGSQNDIFESDRATTPELPSIANVLRSAVTGAGSKAESKAESEAESEAGNQAAATAKGKGKERAGEESSMPAAHIGPLRPRGASFAIDLESGIALARTASTHSVEGSELASLRGVTIEPAASPEAEKFKLIAGAVEKLGQLYAKKAEIDAKINPSTEPALRRTKNSAALNAQFQAHEGRSSRAEELRSSRAEELRQDQRKTNLEICAVTFDMEGAALQVLKDRPRAPTAAGSPPIWSQGAIDGLVREALTHEGKAVPDGVYPKLFENGPGNEPWAPGPTGALDRAAAVFSALKKTVSQTGLGIPRADEVRQALAASVLVADASVKHTMHTIADFEGIRLPASASDSGYAADIGKALSAALKEKNDKNPGSVSKARLSAVADLCEQADYAKSTHARVASKEIKAAHIAQNQAARGFGNFVDSARVMVGSVVPAALSASMHSMTANLFGEYVEIIPKAKVDELRPGLKPLANAISPGIGLGIAIPLVNKGIAPSITSTLEFLHVGLPLTPTDPAVVHPDAPKFAVGPDMQPRKLDNATRQERQAEIEAKRDNFSKAAKEYTYSGISGKNLGYVAYGVGNVIRELAGGVSIPAKVFQVGLSQASASAGMTLGQLKHEVDGWPIVGLKDKPGVTLAGTIMGTNAATAADSKQWERIKNGWKDLDPRDPQARQNFLASVAGSIEAIALANYVAGHAELFNQHLPLGERDPKGIHDAMFIGAGLVPLLVAVFATTEHDVKAEAKRAHDAGIGKEGDTFDPTRIASNHANPLNVFDSHQTHVYEGGPVSQGPGVWHNTKRLLNTVHAGAYTAAALPAIGVANGVNAAIGGALGITKAVIGYGDPPRNAASTA